MTPEETKTLLLLEFRAFGSLLGIMNTTPTPPVTGAATPALSYGQMARVLAHPVRWQILAELSDGAPLMVIEIARRIRRKDDLTSKHLAVLRQSGLVVTGQAGMYRIPPQFLPTPGQRVVDCGTCLLRLNATE